jgi:protein-S-isoprenylcysteine O-methyltransferase Ste14
MNGPTLWTWLSWGWIASEILIALATYTRESGGKVRDRGSQLLLWIVIASSVTGCYWIRDIVPAANLGGTHWLRPLSLIILVGGLAIRWMAVMTLGKSFSSNVAIRESQKVRRTGLYRFVRHPSYLGLLLIFLAIGLHSRNWASLAIALIPTTLALFYRIQVEEAALLEAYGDDYAAYKKVTRCIVPGVF